MDRYWDGNAWTQQLQESSIQARTATAGHGAPARPKKPRPAWALPVGIAVVALLVGVGIGAASSGGTQTKNVAGPTITQTVTQSAAPAVTVQHTVVKTVQPTVKVTVTYTPPPVNPVSDGTYLVGSEIKPGLWKTTDSDTCYWATLHDLLGGIDSIDNNDNIDGQTTIEIPATDKAVEFNGGCTWSKVG